MGRTNLIRLAVMMMPSTGCLGAFVAGKIVDEATCAARKRVKRRQAHLDISITEPSTLDLGWEAKTRAADCDSNAGLEGAGRDVRVLRRARRRRDHGRFPAR